MILSLFLIIFAPLIILIVGSQLYINSHKEPISLTFQHYESMTRLEKESPTMNNVLANNINNSINLIDGLKLRVPDRSYQHRCGNFLDIYELITEFDKIDDYKVGKIVNFFQSKSGRIGLVYDVTHKNGILTILGMLRAVLENNINSTDEQKLELVILDSVPRFKDDSISYLVLDDLKNIRFLNGSEKWYKEVLVVNDISTTGTTNIISINDVKDSIPFNKKVITLDNYLMLDNNKLFEYNDTTFTQNNLVSAISSFLSILPSGHFLTKNDVFTVLVDSEDKSFNNVQLFFKALMMLMTGGKVNFIKLYDNEETIIPKETTLLQATSANINRLLSIGGYQDVKTKFGYRLSKTLQLENVFQKTFKTKLNNLRIIMITRTITQQVSTSHLSLLKTTFQSRLILETYIPMEAGSVKTLGPIFTTNLFDHRTFNPKVEANVTFAGVVYPSLQFKLLKRESDEDKIGELKIRGFTIGLPIKKLKEKYADEIGKDADGWVSVFGVSGCIGADTCFWELNKQN